MRTTPVGSRSISSIRVPRTVVFASSSLPSARPVKKATILLVDDDPFQAYAHKAALERDFGSLERALSASEAFIRMDEPGFAERLAVIVVGLRLPGLAGPAFVSELKRRMPGVPLLVIGREGETAAEYAGASVGFLPCQTSAEELLAEVKALCPMRPHRGSLRLVSRDS